MRVKSRFRMDTKGLARWLSRARKREGLSQEALGEKAGVHGVFISQLENETKNSGGKPTVPQIGTLKAIADALNEDFREPLIALGVLSRSKDEVSGDERKIVGTLRAMSEEGRRAALDVLKIIIRLEGGTAHPVNRPKRPASGEEEVQADQQAG